MRNSATSYPPDVMGEGSTIGAYCMIGKNVKLGKNVTIGNYCQIEDGTIIGDGSILQGEVKTGKDCVIGKNVTLKWGVILTSEVWIGDGAFMGARAVTLGSTAKRETKYGTIIETRAYIGAGVNIAPCTTIGREVVVGAMAYVNNDIGNRGTYVGIPAKRIK